MFSFKLFFNDFGDIEKFILNDHIGFFSCFICCDQLLNKDTERIGEHQISVSN